MPATTHSPADRPTTRLAATLSPRAAFYLLASITASFLAGSSAPTPLYPVYQAEWGFSATMVTCIFGVYAVALLAALLVAGRLSDHIGRRPVLIAATLAQAATMLLFATADGLAGLLVARVLQGLSTGAAVAAVGAGMLDMDKTRGAVANAAAPPLGTATGAILAGLTVHFLPAPTMLVYGVLGVVFVAQAIGVALMAETVTPRAGALASLRPQFSVPVRARRSLMLAAPVLLAAWSFGGFYASLGPALVGRVFGLDASLLGGVALFVLAGSGAASILLMQRHEPHRMMSVGAWALVIGVTVVLTAMSLHSASMFFAGSVVAGVGLGAGFQGAVRTVVPHAAPHERAGLLSVIFVVSYIALSLPAVAAGWLVSHGGNIPATAREYGVVVIALAMAALLGTIGRRAPSRA
ncbi:MAG TPA: MFS transporter [Casimicrobiaceae bacterium]|nr:MFS transporter [Casimicrobiaceae bacterium]